MTKMKKQVKLTKLFQKKRVKIPGDYDETREEVRQLEERLREKHNDLFQIQRNLYRHQSSTSRKKDETFFGPQKIVVNSAIEKLKRDLMLMSMLTGMEVQSYVVNEYCCIVYHIQCTYKDEVKHGLRINLKSDDHVIEKVSMPVGFNINGVIEEFKQLMSPDCLGAIRNGLVAYYDRLAQYENLKELLTFDAHLFRLMDSSHIEVTFTVQNSMDEDDDDYIELLLSIDYKIYDIRPKSLTFRERGLPEGMVDVLNAQCAVFKRKPLAKAFKEAFLKGIGRFNIVRQIESMGGEGRPAKRARSNKRDYNNDDTFLPEDCSDASDDCEQ